MHYFHPLIYPSIMYLLKTHSPSRPWASQKAHHAAAVSNQIIQPVAFLLLLSLPFLKSLEQRLVFHHHIKVKSEEHRHPRLRQLVILSRLQSCRKSSDKVEELVGVVILAQGK